VLGGARLAEADGKEVHDTEDLHIMLKDGMRFELLKGPKGEALLLREW
jgi:hypothetical protein